MDGSTRRHHHTTTDGVERVRADTSRSGDSPSEEEGGEEVALEGTNKDNGFDRVVWARLSAGAHLDTHEPRLTETKVETTVDNDTDNGGNETSVKTSDTITRKGLSVDIYQTVELPGTTSLGGFIVVGETCSGVVEGVDKEKGRGTSSTTLSPMSACAKGDVTLKSLQRQCYPQTMSSNPRSS